jgi:small conductance mechanosensitive channel
LIPALRFLLLALTLVSTSAALAAAASEPKPVESLAAAEVVALDAEAEAALSLPHRLAQLTSGIASDMGGQITNLAAATGDLLSGKLTAPNSGFDSAAFTEAALNLGVVILATLVVFLLARRLARPLFALLSRYSGAGTRPTPVLRLLFCVALATALDLLLVALAYLGGGLIGTFLIGDGGELSTRASLFLNAFLIIEALKVAIRMLLQSEYPGLRLLDIDAAEARFWNRRLGRLITLVGYGLMTVVPLINLYLSTTLGEALATLIMLLAYGHATIVVLNRRNHLRLAIEQRANNTTASTTQILLKLLSRSWHLLAIGYFSLVLVLTFTRPQDALPFALLATAKSIGAIVAGLLLSTFLGQILGHRLTLSAELKRKLPLLEARINSYLPSALYFLRTLLFILVAMLVLSSWGVFNISGWFASATGHLLVSKVIALAIILTVAFVAWVGLASAIEHKLNPATGDGEPTARIKTLLTLFRNAAAITLITMTGMVVLSEIGIDIGPLIAGAGVLGLAIGFGSQKLVQDIITGVFIQLENAMNVGDVVTVGGITGTAERLSIRSVGIRDLSGTYHLIPFSSVDTVSNYMREFGYHVGVYGIAYRESIDEAIIHLRHAFDELVADEVLKSKVLEPIEISGVTALADSSVNIRIRIKTTPGDQFQVGRAYNRLVKIHFDNAGIEIPFPHTTLYFGQEKDGSAPPANLRLEQIEPSHKPG